MQRYHYIGEKGYKLLNSWQLYYQHGSNRFEQLLQVELLTVSNGIFIVVFYLLPVGKLEVFPMKCHSSPCVALHYHDRFEKRNLFVKPNFVEIIQ